ncbi:hypothetical protein [Nonomuraea sp. NPDC050786]|uniref:hypothetical protein n=1 Tax=Nonomuraea sp. NPDC050786 TaxID=3154840 RepID=UPI0033EB8979
MTDRRTNRFARVAAARRKDEAGQVPERGTTAKRTDPVRITVDLDPADYRAMNRLVAEVGDELDVPRLPHSKMWRALLEYAAETPEMVGELARRIRDAD